MSSGEQESVVRNDELDLIGLKAVAKVADKTVDGVGRFLGKICMPVAEELGLYFQDGVRKWRADNAMKVAGGAESILDENGGCEGKNVHPLLAWKIMENASFADTEELQNFWSGMLASSCSEGFDDSNHMFVDIMSQLTKLQVKVLTYACDNSTTYLNAQGFLLTDAFIVSQDEIFDICNCTDLDRVDRELDRLSSLGLITSTSFASNGGFDSLTGDASIQPTPLCLQFYARCRGFNGTTSVFYN